MGHRCKNKQILMLTQGLANYTKWAKSNWPLCQSIKFYRNIATPLRLHVALVQATVAESSGCGRDLSYPKAWNICCLAFCPLCWPPPEGNTPQKLYSGYPPQVLPTILRFTLCKFWIWSIGTVTILMNIFVSLYRTSHMYTCTWVYTHTHSIPL